MASKQLGSILDSIPAATAKGQNKVTSEIPRIDFHHQGKVMDRTIQKEDRLVARIPKELKDEIKQYVSSHSGLTERAVLLQALQKFGFKVEDEWLVDQRTRR